MLETADISDALTALAARQHKYRTYHAYYHGDQPLHFSTDQWHTAFGSLFRRLAYNRARSVVDAFANRLTITGWESPGLDADTDALGQAALAIWERTRMDYRQGELWAEALRSGDAYLIVWPDDLDGGNARLDINRGHLIEPVYDDERPERLLHAVKCWRVTSGPDRGKWRVTTYDAETITRWITKSASERRPEKATVLLPDPDEPETPNPYGVVPVFHVGNNADTGSTGASELVDVIPLQDGVNKSVADMLIAGEYVSFPQRWVVGAAPVNDPFTNEEVEQFKAAVDRVWAVDNEQARFGQFDPADMSQYIAAQDAWDMKIARVSMVPVHWLSMTGTPPSGEALKTAEGPFVAKCRDRQSAWGPVLGDAMAFALRVENAAGEGERVSPIWQQAETRSDLEALQLAALKASLGVPSHQIWAELGYDQEQIAQFQAEKDAAFERQQAAFARSFDRGDEPPFGGQ